MRSVPGRTANDGAAARALAKREVALYLPLVMDLDKTLEIGDRSLETRPEWKRRIRAHAARRDYENVARLISDALLKNFAFAGTVDDIAEQTRELFEAGASRVEFGTPHGFSEVEGMRLLGRVMERARDGEIEWWRDREAE